MRNPVAGSDSTRLELEIETTNVCLFCSKFCSTASGGDDGGSRTSLNGLLRYLNVDVLHPNRPAATVLRCGGNAEVKALLCTECSVTTNRFHEQFQEFERMRLGMENTLGVVHEKIQEGEGKLTEEEIYQRISAKSRGGLLETVLVSNLVGELRQAMTRGCQKMIAASPQVELDTTIRNMPGTSGTQLRAVMNSTAFCGTQDVSTLVSTQNEAVIPGKWKKATHRLSTGGKAPKRNVEKTSRIKAPGKASNKIAAGKAKAIKVPGKRGNTIVAGKAKGMNVTGKRSHKVVTGTANAMKVAGKRSNKKIISEVDQETAKLFRCKRCPMTTKWLGSLVRHQKVTHGLK